MKLTPKDFLDVAVVLIGLLLCAIVVAAVDHVEAGLIRDGHVSVIPISDDNLPTSSLDRAYLSLRNSLRRWLLFYLPALSLVGGAAVGVACSGVRRAWFLAMIALSLIPAMAVAFLFDTPLLAALAAGVYLAIVATSATGSALFLHQRTTAAVLQEERSVDR